MKRLIQVFSIPLVFSGCHQTEHREKSTPPARIEAALPGGMPKVVLTMSADERIGIEVMSVRAGRVPPSVVLYDLKGDAWAYVRIAPQTYSRVHTLSFEKGSSKEVVVRGAAWLYGAESGVGK